MEKDSRAQNTFVVETSPSCPLRTATLLAVLTTTTMLALAALRRILGEAAP